ncbi:MAG TPA: acyl-CoA dehydrogenase family protein [Trebonia sp.]|jgi:alkylation response protein AidB-like acyl-CoA dehydrogenase|nr:acyl-CoA dehydrogenase family protein [Trebonia sp.]
MPEAGVIEDLGTFLARARKWIAANLEPLNGADPFLGHARDEADQVVRAKAIQRKLWDGGFAGLCYPAEYGGQGLPPEYQQAFSHESRGYELPMLFNTPTLTIIMPTILDFGTEEQKQRCIPAVLRGEELWVQFLSEPTGGSDLAGALTRATRDGDVYVLSGSKIWSSYAWRSDYAVCVCRTDWDVPKHRGLSVLMVKVHQPGIQVRQIKQVDGTEEFCQEFFDDVPVPAGQMLGRANDGWTVASRMLFHERAAVSGASPYEVGPRISERRGGRGGLAVLAELAGRREDPRVRQLLGEARVLDRVHRALVRRIGTSIQAGRLPPTAGSIPRLSSGLLGVRLASIALEIAGDRAVAWEAGDQFGELGVAYLARQGGCLGGGTTEIARNIISERVLGMPRERAEDLGVPFREVRTNAMPSRR